jgi:hypothetical protein
MPSCDGYAGRFIAEDGSIPGGFGDHIDLVGATSLVLDDGVLGGHLILTASHPVTIHSQPYFSVSQSEAGFEKIMQAVDVKVSFPVGAEMVSLSVEVNKGQCAV